VLLTYFYLVEGLSGIVFVIIFLLSYFSYIFKFFIKLAMKEKKKKNFWVSLASSVGECKIRNSVLFALYGSFVCSCILVS
jgi:hypothetical protein